MTRSLSIVLAAVLTGFAAPMSCGHATEPTEPTEAAASKGAPRPASVSQTPPPAAEPSAGPILEQAPPRDAAGPDDESVARAHRLLAEMVAAYRAAPTMTDAAKWQLTANGAVTSRIETEIRIGSGMDLWMRTVQSLLVAKGGRMYLTFADFPGRCLVADIEGDVMTTLVKLFGRYGGALAPCALRYDKPIDEILAVLCTGLPDTARVSGYRLITDASGRELEQISLISPTGSAEINVDPKTKFLVRTYVEWVQPDAPVPNFRQAGEMRYEPKVHDELPAPVEFDPTGLVEFRGWREMRGMAGPDTVRLLTVKMGEAAPDFALHTILGGEFTLESKRGSLVLLLFWSWWDGGSRVAIHQAAGLRDWARSENLPLEVWPVHVMGRKETEGEVWEEVLGFMERHDTQFSIDSLLDGKDEVSALFGVTGVPITLLLDRDGKLQHVGTALSGELAEELKPVFRAIARGEPVPQREATP